MIKIKLFVWGLKIKIVDYLRRFERCAICGWLLRGGAVIDYHGGIEDTVTKKTYYVCIQCYDWFYYVNPRKKSKREIQDNKIVWVSKK